MNMAFRNKKYIDENGQEILKLPRVQVGTDDRDNPVYDYVEPDDSRAVAINAIVMPLRGQSDKQRRSSGQRFSREIEIKVKEDVSYEEITHFYIDGVEYEIESPEPARVGLRVLLLQVVQA